jgi:ParB family transcriptional regulator, chromosome partitioning protein
VVGKSRSHITNILRLLTLPQSILQSLEQGKLTMGHARALIGHPNAEAIAKEILEKNLNVRDVESLIKKKSSKIKTDKLGEKPNKERLNEHLAEIEKLLTSKLKSKIKIRSNSVDNGTITIKYTSLDKLDQLLQLLGKNFDD